MLKPQGEVGILDFGEPGGLMGKLYRFYFRKILPVSAPLFPVCADRMNTFPLLCRSFLRRSRCSRACRLQVSKRGLDALHVWNCRAISWKEIVN